MFSGIIRECRYSAGAILRFTNTNGINSGETSNISSPPNDWHYICTLSNFPELDQSRSNRLSINIIQQVINSFITIDITDKKSIPITSFDVGLSLLQKLIKEHCVIVDITQSL